jgi:hypothetical protein
MWRAKGENERTAAPAMTIKIAANRNSPAIGPTFRETHVRISSGTLQRSALPSPKLYSSRRNRKIGDATLFRIGHSNAGLRAGAYFVE